MDPNTWYQPMFHNPWTLNDQSNYSPYQGYGEPSNTMAYSATHLSPTPSLSTMPLSVHRVGPFLHHINEDSITQPLPGPIRYATFVENDRYASTPGLSPESSRSALPSTYTGSSMSDRHLTPRPSPEIRDLILPGDARWSNNLSSCAFGGDAAFERRDSHFDGRYIALNEVQKHADEQPEALSFADEQSWHIPSFDAYTMFPQEGYQPMEPKDEATPDTYPSAPSPECQQQDTPQRRNSEEPVIRRRRAPTVVAGRVSKRPSVGKRATSYHGSSTIIKTEAYVNDARTEGGHALFLCPLHIYGCDSGFVSKNEWKRHMVSQHLRPGYWRCILCSTGPGSADRKPNDFNRKDLFQQHVRRMHPRNGISPVKSNNGRKKDAKTPQHPHSQADDAYLAAETARCYRHLRFSPEASCCLICEHRFSGPGSWDERMEHVGRHMENAKKGLEVAVEPDEWNRDEETERYLIRERIVERDEDGELVLVEKM